MARTPKLMWIRVTAILSGLTAACWAQGQPDALSGFQANAEKRSAEWTTLAVNLEQRVTRLLPCDPRIRTAIEETSRASEARITALSTYWLGVAGNSRSQIEVARRLLTQEEARREDWTAERTHADEERAALTEQAGFLAVSANRLAALSDAQKSLAATQQAVQQIHASIQAREASGEQLRGELRDLIAAMQARQNDIDAQVKLIAVEGTRWGAYYDARQKRAQMECAITNPGADAPRPAPAPPRGGKKQ